MLKEGIIAVEPSVSADRCTDDSQRTFPELETRRSRLFCVLSQHLDNFRSPAASGLSDAFR